MWTPKQAFAACDAANAVLFLGFKGLVVPSARWECNNLVVFTERTDPGQQAVIGVPKSVDWTAWRESRVAARGHTESGSQEYKTVRQKAKTLDLSKLSLGRWQCPPSQVWAAGATTLICIKGASETTSRTAMSRERCGGAFPPSISGDHHAILPA
jgi:hypothetical protein